MPKESDHIHHERLFYPSELYLPGFVVVVMSIIVIQGTKSVLAFLMLWLVFILIAAIFLYFSSPYTVYNSRIEVIHPFTKEITKRIFFEDIDAVRYEYDFQYQYGNISYIIFYPKVGENKVKGFRLHFRGYHQEENILKLLKFYQSKGIKIVLKTGEKKWLKELDIKNWNEP